SQSPTSSWRRGAARGRRRGGRGRRNRDRTAYGSAGRGDRREGGPRTPPAWPSGQWSWQVGLAHEVEIDATGARAALGDRPHDQRLAPLHVATGEDTGDAGHPVPIAHDVAAVGQREAERRDRARALGTEEPHREQDEIH